MKLRWKTLSATLLYNSSAEARPGAPHSLPRLPVPDSIACLTPRPGDGGDELHTSGTTIHALQVDEVTVYAGCSVVCRSIGVLAAWRRIGYCHVTQGKVLSEVGPYHSALQAKATYFAVSRCCSAITVLNI